MNKNPIRPVLILIEIILAFVIFKHFDIKSFTLKAPWLDLVYIITFLTILFLLVKDKYRTE